MNTKRILEAVAASIAAYVIVKWWEKNHGSGATAAAYVPGSTSSSQGVMA